MHTPPRIEFSMFRSDLDPMLLAWGRFRNRLAIMSPTEAIDGVSTIRSAAPPSPPTEWGVWRLLASNNREVARSARAYRSLPGARRHVLRVQESVDDLAVSIVPGPVTGMRGWFVSLDGVPVMTCGRWYPAASSCAEASESALDLLRSATVALESRRSAGDTRRGGALRSDRSASHDHA